MKLYITAFAILLTGSLLIAQCPGGGGGSGGSSAGSSLSSSSNSFGSNTISNDLAQQTMLNAMAKNSYASTRLQYNQIEGSPFLNDEPIEGTLVLNNNTEVLVPLQIDIYSEKVIATNSEGQEIALDGRFYKEVRLPYEGQELVFKKVDSKNPSKFFQVLYEDGDMIFFKQKYASLRQASNNGIAKTEAQFSQRTKYYIKYGDNQVARVKLKKKEIFPHIPETELYAMQDYARKKGIKLKNEIDFITFFEGAKK